MLRTTSSLNNFRLPLRGYGLVKPSSMRTSAMRAPPMVRASCQIRSISGQCSFGSNLPRPSLPLGSRSTQNGNVLAVFDLPRGLNAALRLPSRMASYFLSRASTLRSRFRSLSRLALSSSSKIFFPPLLRLVITPRRSQSLNSSSS